jgi:carbon monoxide dehydrogenase subunit G
LEFTGSFTTTAPTETVVKNLADVSFVSQCLPTLGKLEIISPDEFLATFKVDLSEAASKMHLDYLSRITVKMHFKYLEKSDHRILLAGNGRVVGTKLDVTIRLEISEANDQRLVAWTAQVEFGKLLKLFGESLVRDVSRNIIDDLTGCLKSKLAAAS